MKFHFCGVDPVDMETSFDLGYEEVALRNQVTRHYSSFQTILRFLFHLILQRECQLGKVSSTAFDQVIDESSRCQERLFPVTIAGTPVNTNELVSIRKVTGRG